MFEIRPVAPAEYDVLGALLVEAYDTVPGAERDAQYNLELADVEIRASRSTVLVAVNDVGAVVGGITYTDGGGPLCELSRKGEGEIRMFAVAQSARGQGIGSALVNACIALAKQQQRCRVWRSTSPWMTDAQRLYERLGFLRRSDRDRVERSSGQDWELWAYVLTLETGREFPYAS